METASNKSLTKIEKRDSFAERRKLFKDIWDTALTIDDKETENAKPKVIKTLRVDDDIDDKQKVKKQRIKNLRTVCTRLLDFCDRQDAADKAYKRTLRTRHESANSSVVAVEPQKTKKKRFRKKKKIYRTFGYTPKLPMSEPDQNKLKQSFDSKQEGPITHRGTKPQRNASSPRVKRAFLIKQFITERFTLDNPNPALVSSDPNEKSNDAPRKVAKKKQGKRKKPSVVTPASPLCVNSNLNKKVPVTGMKKK